MKAKQFLARAAFAAAALAGAQCLHAAQIVVGQVGPLSGLEASQGRAYGAGLQLLFEAVNKSGGVNGHTFTLVRRDDGGRPEDTVAQTKALLAEDKPMVLSGFFGARNLADVLKEGLLEKEKIALVGYRVAEIRPETPLVYNVRAGLKEEIDKLTQHLATIGITRLGLFYEQGPGAQALLAAADEAAKKARATIVGRGAYAAGTASAQAGADALLKVQPQAIMLISTGAAAAAFIEAYRGGGGGAQLFTHSGADIEQMSKRLSEEQMQGIAITQVTPSPYKIGSRVAKEFNDLAAKAKLEVPISYAMIEGFIAGKVIVEAVRRQGKTPTRDGMAAALDSISTLDLGGYAVAYRPDARTGSRFVELSIITGTGKIRQ